VLGSSFKSSSIRGFAAGKKTTAKKEWESQEAQLLESERKGKTCASAGQIKRPVGGGTRMGGGRLLPVESLLGDRNKSEGKLVGNVVGVEGKFLLMLNPGYKEREFAVLGKPEERGEEPKQKKKEGFLLGIQLQ